MPESKTPATKAPGKAKAPLKLLVTIKPGNPQKGAERQFLGVGADREAAVADAVWVAKNCWFTHSVVVGATEELKGTGSSRAKSPARAKAPSRNRRQDS